MFMESITEWVLGRERESNYGENLNRGWQGQRRIEMKKVANYGRERENDMLEIADCFVVMSRGTRRDEEFNESSKEMVGK